MRKVPLSLPAGSRIRSLLHSVHFEQEDVVFPARSRPFGEDHVYKVDPSGSVVWVANFPGRNASIRHLHQAPDGYITISGAETVRKLAANDGDTVWQVNMDLHGCFFHRGLSTGTPSQVVHTLVGRHSDHYNGRLCLLRLDDQGHVVWFFVSR